MLNKNLLEIKIKEKGFKMSYLAEKLGITQSTFTRKKKGEPGFSVSEQYMLSDLLGLTEDEKKAIFLPRR